MRRLASLGIIGLLLVTTAACGSEDDEAADSTPTQETSATPTPSPTEQATEAESTEAGQSAAAAGEIPSYDEVKTLWLANTTDGDRASCETKPTEDKKIFTSNDGEYIRYFCASLARFDYVTGAENYAENFEAATEDLVGRAVFHIPGQAYVKPAGANVDLAPAIQEACGCGEVVGPE